MARLSPVQREAAREAHNAFCARYQFFKVRGQSLVGPRELRRYAVAALGQSCLPWVKNMPLRQRRDIVDELLRDDAWLRRRTNEALPRVLEAIEQAASHLVMDAKVREEHPEMGKHLDWRR